MAQGRLESTTSLNSSELHSARENRAVFLPLETSEIYPKTFEDVVEWMGCQVRWFKEVGKPRDQWDKPAIREAHQLEHTARRRVLTDIAWHDKISNGSPEAYEDLLEKFYQARLEVKRPKGPHANKSNTDRFILGNLLIRHKLVKSLSDEGLAIRHSTLKENDSGIDLAIPVSSDSQSILKLRIQPGPSLNGEIIGVPEPNNNLTLYVPLRYGTDMAALGQEEISILADTLGGVYSLL